MRKRQSIKEPCTRSSGTAGVRTDPTPADRRRKMNRLSSDSPHENSSETPRIFIRGLPGGSIKTDLDGVGVDLSQSAFGFSVPDDSLNNLGIHRGDIAIIDPMRDMLQKGNLVLLDSNGSSMLRRLTKKRGVWYFEAANGAKPEPTPLLDQPLHGLVLGIIRLFTQMTAVNYRRTSANFQSSLERSSSHGNAVKSPRGVATAPARSCVRYSKGKRASFLLAAEEQSPYRLSEI